MSINKEEGLRDGPASANVNCKESWLEAIDRVLTEADRALTSATRHGDRTDLLIEEIRRLRVNNTAPSNPRPQR